MARCKNVLLAEDSMYKLPVRIQCVVFTFFVICSWEDSQDIYQLL